MSDRSTSEQQLSELFGSYKAEWLREHIFDLFAEPSYFPELTTTKPCILLGGRGTGKTTVLRGLSYEGQFAIRGRDSTKIAQWPYYGFYYRVNTNRVKALDGPELTEIEWRRIFGHYFNLVCSDHVLRFLQWFERNTASQVELMPAECALVSNALNVPQSNDLGTLSQAVANALVDFESFVNNVADQRPPALSMQGAAIDTLMQVILSKTQFRGKLFFFLIDEYENFTDYQQQVVNTLIKHSGELYSFKIGVRELGWRRRSTINENEQLVNPADYVRINIAEELGDNHVFARFATEVFENRLAKIDAFAAKKQWTMTTLLPGLSEDSEADALGVREAIEQLADKLVGRDDVATRAQLSDLTDLEAYLILAWAEARTRSVPDLLRDRWRYPEKWRTRFQNYKHSLLYTIRRGKRGIRKYYCGWDTFTQLAGGNIRYAMDLVHNTLIMHCRSDHTLGESVSQKLQTEAAQFVGRKNLADLEGLAVNGAQLTKLLLGLGRIFQVMAADAVGHAPEINQFHLAEPIASRADPEERQRAAALLNSAVMHLALLRSTGTKLGDVTDTRAYDYMVHPIFSAFFEFSYRKKRKMRLTERALLKLISNPKEAIREVLERQNREEDELLPQQALPFAAFYSGDS